MTTPTIPRAEHLMAAAIRAAHACDRTAPRTVFPAYGAALFDTLADLLASDRFRAVVVAHLDDLAGDLVPTCEDWAATVTRLREEADADRRACERFPDPLDAFVGLPR